MSEPKEFHIPITEPDITAVDCLAEASGLSKQMLKQVMQKGCVWLEQHSSNRADEKQFIQRLRRAKRVLKPGETLHFYYDEAVLQEKTEEAVLVVTKVPTVFGANQQVCVRRVRNGAIIARCIVGQSSI